jgi:hypothetical protein
MTRGPVTHLVFRSRSVPVLLAALALVLSGAGCAHTIRVRTVQLDEAQRITKEKTIWVAPSPDADESAWDLSPKVEALLEGKGYAMATREDADLIVFHSNNINSFESRVRLALGSGMHGGISWVSHEGPYERSISVRAIAAEPFRTDEEEVVVWAGGALLDRAPTESPRFDDLLLVVAFKYFPEDTGKTLKVRMGINSPQVQKLRKIEPEEQAPGP